MNPLLESELDHRSQNFSGEREISLGPGTILGIFFGLALVCACFFGFGYSVGRHSAQLATPAPVVIPSSTAASVAKPAAGTAGIPAPAVPAQADTNDTANASTASTGARVLQSDAIIAGDKPAPATAATPASAGVGFFIVQVAAVSTQQLADIEVAALRKDGYEVAVRHEPQDNLFHVQLGPYTDKKAADAMRQRILADGFNAIVK